MVRGERRRRLRGLDLGREWRGRETIIGSPKSCPNLLQVMGTRSEIKVLRAKGDEKDSDFAQLKMSQHRAIGRRGRADVGDAGIRRGRMSLGDGVPLNSKLKKMPLGISSPLRAWIKGARRAGHEII